MAVLSGTSCNRLTVMWLAVVLWGFVVLRLVTATADLVSVTEVVS